MADETTVTVQTPDTEAPSSDVMLGELRATVASLLERLTKLEAEADTTEATAGLALELSAEAATEAAAAADEAEAADETATEALERVADLEVATEPEAATEALTEVPVVDPDAADVATPATPEPEPKRARNGIERFLLGR